ncbi:hypothetical protein BDZ89DRAFT_1058501 [Hymenopellis radicata]|nr:hypothetical protein BDZ89DRAFT_1058501 [Hymenopellis radicata]
MRKDECVELAMRLVDHDTFRQWSQFSSYQEREGWKTFKGSIHVRYEETWEYYEEEWNGESHYGPDDEYVESCFEDGTLRPYLKAFWKELAWRREDEEDSYDDDDYNSEPCIIASTTPSEPPIIDYPSPLDSQVDPHTDQQQIEEDMLPCSPSLDKEGSINVHYDAVEVDAADEKSMVFEEQPECDPTEEILHVEADHCVDQSISDTPAVSEDYAATATSVFESVESSADVDEPPKAVHTEADAAQIPAIIVIAPESTPMTATRSVHATEKKRTLVPQTTISPSYSSRCQIIHQIHTSPLLEDYLSLTRVAGARKGASVRSGRNLTRSWLLSKTGSSWHRRHGEVDGDGAEEKINGSEVTRDDDKIPDQPGG